MSNIVTSNKDNWIAIREQAEAVKKAGLLPQAMSAEQATIIILKGQELGIGTMRSLEGLYVVNGKIGMSANLVMGLIRERCPKAKIVVKRKDNKGCVIEAERPGQAPETFQFLEADAHAAGLIKPNSPWVKFPANMYWSRCVTQLGRQLFSDIIGASYTPEELGDDKNIEHDVSERETLPGPSNHHQEPVKEVVPPKGATVSSLNSRFENASLAVTSPPKQKIQAQPVEVNPDTGEVTGYPETTTTTNIPEPKGISESEQIPDFFDGITNASHWDQVSKSGVNAGKTLRQVFDEVGKDGLIQLYVRATKSIGQMQSEGKTVPATSLETYTALQKCCADLGAS